MALLRGMGAFAPSTGLTALTALRTTAVAPAPLSKAVNIAPAPAPAPVVPFQPVTSIFSGAPAPKPTTAAPSMFTGTPTTVVRAPLAPAPVIVPAARTPILAAATAISAAVSSYQPPTNNTTTPPSPTPIGTWGAPAASVGGTASSIFAKVAQQLTQSSPPQVTPANWSGSPVAGTIPAPNITGPTTLPSAPVGSWGGVPPAAAPLTQAAPAVGQPSGTALAQRAPSGGATQAMGATPVGSGPPWMLIGLAGAGVLAAIFFLRK